MDADSEMLRILGNMGSQDTQSRLEAVRYLGENGDDRAIQPLCEALLRDKSLDVRESAANSLSKIDIMGDSADALLKAIENHRDAEWKDEYCILTEVVMALGKVCTEHPNDAPFHSEVIEKLTEIMLDSSLTLPETVQPREGFENGRCNAEAAIALGWVGDKSSIGSLVKAFSQNFDSYEFDKEGYDEEIACNYVDKNTLSRDDFINHTSSWAMWSIGQIGHTDALPQLRKLLQDLRIKWDNDDCEYWELGLWASVVEAIGKCGNNSIHVYNPSDSLWDFIQHLIKTDSNNWTGGLRCSLLSALIEIDDSNLTRRLIEVLEEEEITSLHGLAAKALGEIGDTIAVKPLCDLIRYNIDLWSDRGWAWPGYGSGIHVLGLAIRALGEIGDESSIDILVESLWWVENQPFSLDYYMPTAEDSVFALASIGTGRAIDELIRFLNDSQPIQNDHCSSNIHNLIRFIIVEKLEEMDVDRSIDVLIGRLDDTDIKVRAAAASALGHFRAEGAVEPLTKLLNRGLLHETELSRDDWGTVNVKIDKTTWTKKIVEDDRIQSAIALGKIANRDSSEDLIRALNDDYHLMRVGAAQGLTYFVDNCSGYPSGLTKPLSLAFHQDDCEDVRKYSRIAIAKIIAKTNYNFSQDQWEVFGFLAEGTAGKIFDEHVLDTNLSEGLKWLSGHGYR